MKQYLRGLRRVGCGLILVVAIGSPLQLLAQEQLVWPTPPRATDGTVLVPLGGELRRADSLVSVCSQATVNNHTAIDGEFVLIRDMIRWAGTTADAPDRNQRLADWWVRAMPHIECPPVYSLGFRELGSVLAVAASHGASSRFWQRLQLEYDVSLDMMNFPDPLYGRTLFEFTDSTMFNGDYELPNTYENLQNFARYIDYFLPRVFQRTTQVSALLAAAMRRQSEQVDAALQQGDDPNARIAWNRSALHLSALSPDLDTVRLLVRAGATVNSVDRYGDTPLHLAIKAFSSSWDPEEDIEEVRAIVRELVQAGADVNAQNSYGFSPLMYAVAAYDLSTVRLLLAEGADPNRANREGYTALHILLPFSHDQFGEPDQLYDGSRLDNHFAVLIELLRAGADVNSANMSQRTALHEALSGTIYRLWSRSVRAVDGVGSTGDGDPEVLIDHDYRIAQALLNAGADVTRAFGHQAMGRRTPLMQASTGFSDVRLVRLIVRAGADLESTNTLGQTALHQMISNTDSDDDRNREKIWFLINAGASIYTEDRLGNTLIASAGRDDLEFVEYLLGEGLSANGYRYTSRTDDDGRTIIERETYLERAERLWNHERLAELLRRYGAR